jgi:activator of HSP90 ATPase
MVTIRRRDVPALLAGIAAAGNLEARAATDPHQDEGLSFTSEALHQEITFAAKRSRLYSALIDARQFGAVTLLSDAAKSMRLGKAPTQIDPTEGGSFVLFGDYILGRTVELVPDTRIVQAWREKTWPDGVYSIVTIALSDHGTGTKLTFDHTGFPKGAGHHLSIGWFENYWEPLRKYLG